MIFLGNCLPDQERGAPPELTLVYPLDTNKSWCSPWNIDEREENKLPNIFVKRLQISGVNTFLNMVRRILWYVKINNNGHQQYDVLKLSIARQQTTNNRLDNCITILAVQHHCILQTNSIKLLIDKNFQHCFMLAWLMDGIFMTFWSEDLWTKEKRPVWKRMHLKETTDH